MSLLLPLTTRITAKSKKKTKNRVLQAAFGNGYGQVANDGINSSVDEWVLVYSPLEGQNLIDIQDFYATVGVTTYFRWTPLGETLEKKWRIIPDSWTEELINTSKFQISFKIVQVFDLGT